MAETGTKCVKEFTDSPVPLGQERTTIGLYVSVNMCVWVSTSESVAVHNLSDSCQQCTFYLLCEPDPVPTESSVRRNEATEAVIEDST